MPSKTQPRACHRDMVGSTFALCFDEQFSPCNIFAVPSRERSQQLQAVRSRRYNHLHTTTIGCRSLVTWVVFSKSFGRQLFTIRRFKFHFLAFVVGERIGNRVKIQSTGNSQSSYHFRRSNKSVCIGVAVSTFREVAIERMYNCIFLLLFSTLSVPLTDTRATSIGKYFST